MLLRQIYLFSYIAVSWALRTMNSDITNYAKLRFVFLTLILVQILTFWDVSLSANSHWRFTGLYFFHLQGIIHWRNPEDWNRKLLRKASHYLLTDTASYQIQRNVLVISLWNCRQQNSLSTVLHLRDIKERSQDPVVLQNASRPCPGVCGAQIELTPTLSPQNGVSFSEQLPYKLLHNSCASTILSLSRKKRKLSFYLR
jgi:hypothetical protein